MDLIGRPEINPCLYDQQLMYGKGGNNIQWSKSSLFKKWYRENWTDICKNNETELLFYTINKK